jgi:hypothetical protein
MSPAEIPLPSVVWQNRPAQHRRAVYLCADAKFMPYTLFLAQQIDCNHPQRDFDICIVSASAIAPHPLYDLHHLRAVQIDTGAMEAQVRISDRIGYATYLRIFMPRLWQDEYDRLFYLDGDIFYQRGDISALLAQDMAGCALAAVPDCQFWERPGFHARDIQELGLPAAPYFNAGVLLIDVPRFVGGGYYDRVIELIVTRGHELGGHDQTALNAVMANAWAELPVQWNYQYHYSTMLWAGYFDICLYHFVGTRKPFYAKYGANARRFTTPYRQFLGQHFPALAAQVNDGLGGPRNWFWLLVVVMYNLGKLRGILLLDAKFQGDFDIRPITAAPTPPVAAN